MQEAGGVRPVLEGEQREELERRMKCLSGAATLTIAQCTRDSARVFRHLHNSSPSIAPEKLASAVCLPPPPHDSCFCE